MHKNKVVVIGLDGATYRVMDPLLEAGRLPGIARLVERGGRCVLRSTMNPNSFPAWTSFMTGMNPGKHGIFSPHKLKKNSYDMEIVDFRDVEAATMWDIAGAAGRSAGIINVPMTFPAAPVNGFLVSGFTADLRGAVYPESLKEEIARAVPGYEVDIVPDAWKKRKTWEAARRCVEARRKAALHLFRKFDPDLAVVVFTMLDRVQHVFWDDMDETHHFHSRSTGEFGDAIPRMYEMLDAAVGELAGLFGEDATYVVLSDHGFCPYRKKFHINRFLNQKGFLNYKKDPLGVAVRKAKEISSALGVTRIVRRVIPMPEVTAQRFRGMLASQFIDWGRTRVFADVNVGLRVNLRGKFPNGVVEPGAERDEVLEALGSELGKVRDPDTGEKMFGQIVKREEVLSGDHLDGAPDMYAVPADPSTQLWAKHEVKSLVQEAEFPSPPGTHDHDGVFIAAGPGIISGSRFDARPIWDSAPTLLYALGVPIPENMDGKVIGELFERDYFEKNPPVFQPPFFKESEKELADDFGGRDKEEIERRLRGLGYID